MASLTSRYDRSFLRSLMIAVDDEAPTPADHLSLTSQEKDKLIAQMRGDIAASEAERVQAYERMDAALRAYERLDAECTQAHRDCKRAKRGERWVTFCAIGCAVACVLLAVMVARLVVKG